MTLLYSDPKFLNHKTGSHPEQPARLSRITAHLEKTGLDKRCKRPSWQPVSLERIGQVHSLDYAGEVREFAKKGGGRIEADTIVSDESYEVARLAAGAVCDAVEQVVAEKDKTALCLVRPPGHHAVKKSAMGFCLFNNIAIAARVAIEELHLDKVLIIDWDVHHGNGTQDAFYEDEQIAFLSIHRWPFYPGTGTKEETGAGKGLGTNVNLPTPFETSRDDYRKSFRNALEDFAGKIRPQLVLLSAGFDSHREDPIGSLGLENEDFATLTNDVIGIAKSFSDGKLVSVLEGGYNIDVLPKCVGVHLEALLKHE